jgi:hypothetical protein
MYNKTIVKPGETGDWKETAETQVLTLDKPIKKIFTIEDLDSKSEKVDNAMKPAIPPFPGPEWKIQLIEPTVGVEDLKDRELYFKP